MKPITAVLWVTTFAAVFGQAPNDCNLNIRTISNVTTSFVGTGLNYCRTSERQCCSNDLFSFFVRSLREGLVNSLRDQIGTNDDFLRSINTSLYEYVDTVFIPRFFTLLEAPMNLSQNVSAFNTNIRSNFFLRPHNPGEANFTVQGFTEGFIRSQINLLMQSVVVPFVPQNNGSGMSPLSTEQQTCAMNYFLTYVNLTTKNHVDESIQELRLAITAVNRIRSWFELVFLSNISRYFTPLDACITAFVNLRCQECVANIPRTCRGVCNAVVYGCYSVIQNALRGQFNVLWNVTDQLVRISREAVRNVSAVLPDHLLTVNFTNSTLVVGGLRSQCNINLNQTSSSSAFPRSRTLNASEVIIDIPDRVFQNTSSLLGRGLVFYSENGTLFCQSRENTNCWNGTATVSTFVPIFNDTSIDAQANNPFIDISVDDLRRQISSIGNPVTDYLSTNSSIQEVLPRELVVPEDSAYTDSGVGTISMSFIMASLMVLIASC